MVLFMTFPAHAICFVREHLHTGCFHVTITEFKPVSREVVIDIDLTDYDGLRTCGSGGHICARCWPFMAVAIQVRHLEQALA